MYNKTSINPVGAGSNVALVDSSGNPLSSQLQTNGDYHLGVSMAQDIYADSNNSSTTNLTSGNSHTFTGTGTSTLGVAGLQWNLKTDQNATVYIEQSDDNINWDVSDTFDYVVGHSAGGNTVQAVTSYWRIRVILTGSTDTTYFRLAGVLCPIVEPLPRALSHNERLMTESTLVGSQTTGRHVWVNPTNEIAVSPVYRMIGTTFDGSTLDPNFWNDGECLRDGTVVQSNGEIKLLTNTTANGLSILQSVRKARFVAGSAMIFECLGSFKTAATVNNTRRLGAYTLDGSLDVEDGFYFQISGTTFSLGYARDGSVTLINSGSFNGKLGIGWSPTVDTYYKMSIEYAPAGAFWYIDGVLLHLVKAGHPSAYLTLPITMENENIGNITTSIELHCVGVYVGRQGELQTNSTYKYIGTDTTTICKYGAGVLHRVNVLDNAGRIIVYDNTAGSGTIICNIDAAQGSEPLGTMDFNCPFNDGLTIVTSSSARCTVIYE